MQKKILNLLRNVYKPEVLFSWNRKHRIIKKLRTKQGLSQDDLARKAELKYSTLAKIKVDFVKSQAFS